MASSSSTGFDSKTKRRTKLAAAVAVVGVAEDFVSSKVVVATIVVAESVAVAESVVVVAGMNLVIAAADGLGCWTQRRSLLLSLQEAASSSSTAAVVASAAVVDRNWRIQ